ncbi:hypothetical protein [Streptomyces sp. NPDC056632]|uniref:hypothetical protein n=1 Tax=Streptomyces sp. NPDC056632 TaxID=3345884 RepID=UPI00368F2F5D
MAETETAPSDNAAGEAISALYKVIAALGSSDPQTFYAASQVMERIGNYISRLSGDILDQSNKLFMGGAQGEAWTGEGAAACARMVGQFNQYLTSILPLVRQWPEPLRSAGEALQQAWYDTDAILAKYSTGGDGAPPPAPEPAPPATPEPKPPEAKVEEWNDTDLAR